MFKKLLEFDEYIEKYYQINEDKKETHDYGCAMLFFDAEPILKIQDDINPDDLEKTEAKGLEDDFHITLLYGLHSDEIDDKKVIDICHSEKISELKLHNPSLFENEKFDVLKFDVKYIVKGGAFLHKINKKLSELPHTTKFPDYHPHCTIAYLKPGHGKKYIKTFKDIELIVKPDRVVYSKPNGDKVTDKINFESVINESINPMIQALIDDMIENKIQRKTITIKDRKGFNQFIKDSQSAVDANLLTIKENPIDKNEIWISLGPAAINKSF